MSLRLNGSTSGYVELDAPATAGSNTLVLPDGNGFSGQYLQTNGSGALSWQTVTDTTGWTYDSTGTSLSSQSSVSVTGIPSTATRIFIAVDSLSLTTDNDWYIRVGTSSGLATSGYDSVGSYYGNISTNSRLATNGFYTFGLAAGVYVNSGFAKLEKMVGNGNKWFLTYFNKNSANGVYSLHGSVLLGSTLDRIGFVTSGGSFDSGTIYVHYQVA